MSSTGHRTRARIYIALVAVLLLLCASSVSAHYPLVHPFPTLKAFRTTDSAITRRCTEEQVMAGNQGSDVFVVHYNERNEKLGGYIGSHTYSAHIRGFKFAVTDEQRCIVHGSPTHLIQDSFSHLESGIVPKFISKFWGLNLFWHSAVEKAFELQMLDYLERNPDPVVSVADLKYYAAHSLDVFFEDEANMDLLSQMGGIDARNDAGIVDRALKSLEGDTTLWEKEVYGKEVKFPGWAFVYVGLVAGLGGLFILLFFINLLFNHNKAWFDLVLGLIIFSISMFILISVLSGNYWRDWNTIVSIPGKLGMIHFTDAEIKDQLDKMTAQTSLYFETEKLTVDDASGLTYCKVYGQGGTCQEWQQGALNQSEWKFNWFLLPFLVILPSILIFFRIRKAWKGG